MNTTDNLKTSLDDLVALLLQGQAPFGDTEFIAACAFYRQNRPGGAIARAQVNLAACLYLSVKGERITEPRIRELGGWGQRNALLSDMASFNRGQRPASASSMGKSMLALGAPAADVLQIAVSQGLEAAQRAIETEMQARFDRRVEEIQTLADQRVLAAERNAMAVTELKEAAQAESRMMEQKFDQALIGRTELTNRAVAAEARAQELATQVSALTASLATANERLAAAEEGARTLQVQLSDLQALRETERRDHLLALDRARHGQDQLLATQQGEISRLGALLEKAQESGEAHAQAARRAEALAASTQAELAASVAKTGDLLAQVEVLTVKFDEAVARAGAGEAIVGALQVLRKEISDLAQVTVQGTAVKSIEIKLGELSEAVRRLGDGTRGAK